MPRSFMVKKSDRRHSAVVKFRKYAEPCLEPAVTSHGYYMTSQYIPRYIPSLVQAPCNGKQYITLIYNVCNLSVIVLYYFNIQSIPLHDLSKNYLIKNQHCLFKKLYSNEEVPRPTKFITTLYTWTCSLNLDHVISTMTIEP